MDRQLAAPAGPLRLGFGRVDITPPLAIPYLSYQPRQTAFAGVHDRLYARAMVADNGATRLAIVAIDALGLSADVAGPERDIIAEIRARIEAATGIAPDHVLLSASHAHSTPQTTHIARLLDVPEAGPWLERLMERMAEAVAQAQERVQPSQLKGAVGEAAGIGWNRRIGGADGKLYRLPNRPAAIRSEPLDDSVPLLLAEQEDGRRGVLCNFACHPVTVQVQPLVSGDFPAYACALVERELSAAACLFLQGAAGDINPVRHTSNFGDVQTYGQILGAAVLQHAARLSAPEAVAMSATLNAGRRVVHLPARELPARAPLAALQADAEQRMASGDANEARRALADYRRLRETLRLIDLGSDAIACEVQVLRLGDALIVTLPGELFCRFGLALKAASPAPITLIAAYANGYVGYLPGREDYDLGGYEVSLGPWTRLAPGGTERLVQEAQQLMAEVWAGHPPEPEPE